MSKFRKNLEVLINQNSIENGSNTPDFILADYLVNCLAAFDKATKQRTGWYNSTDNPLSFNKVRKGTAIKEVFNRIIEYYYEGLDGYVMFEDDWITENDKILYNQNNQLFNVLGFKVIEKNILVNPLVAPFSDGWGIRKFSCVKLDKEFNLTDVFYTELETPILK